MHFFLLEYLSANIFIKYELNLCVLHKLQTILLLIGHSEYKLGFNQFGSIV